MPTNYYTISYCSSKWDNPGSNIKNKEYQGKYVINAKKYYEP